MCRLVAYIGKPILAADLVTLPTRSIIKQSYDSRERITPQGYLNGDGFGLGWYAPEVADADPTPCVFTSVKPAWNNSNLYNLGNKIITPLLFAHIRAATQGLPVSESSCHPFYFGRYMFMHNGDMAGHHQVRREICQNLGDRAYLFATEHSSDSGLAFAIFLDQLEDIDQILTPDELRKKIERVIIIIRDAQDKKGVMGLSLFNFVVSDGYSICATRVSHQPGNPFAAAASMYIASGTGFIPGETPGEYRMKHGGGAKNCAIVSSEPLTDDNADWMPIPRNYVVLITEDINVLMAPIVIQGLDTWVCKEKHKISADLSRCLERLNNRSNYGKGESLSQVVSQNVTSLIADSAQRQLISRMEKQEASNVHSGNSKHSLDEINTNFISMKSLSTGLGRAGSMTTLDQRHKASRSLAAYSTDKSSVLAVIACKKRQRVYCGLDDHRIHVIDLKTHSTHISFSAHRRAVLCLSLWGDYLASGSSDRAVKIWNADTFELLAEIPFGAAVLCMGIANGTLWVGLQNTSVRSCSINEVIQQRMRVTPPPMPHDNGPPQHRGSIADASQALLVTNKEGQQCGFVHAMAILGRWVCTAAGDGSIKTFHFSDERTSGDDCTTHSPHRLSGPHLFGHRGGVHTLATDEHTDELYSGSSDRTVKCWDVEAVTCKRTLMGHEYGVTSIALSPTTLFSGDMGGQIRLWCRNEWTQLKVLHTDRNPIQSLYWDASLFSGGSDAVVREWGDFNHDGDCTGKKSPSTASSLADKQVMQTEGLLGALSSFIAIPSVSGDPACKDHCWNASKFLSARLEAIGASVKLATAVEGQNPVVLARLGEDKSKPTVVVYGHYDVQPARHKYWKTDPWVATSIDGYIYGRGTTDDKGPILATIFAVQQLVEENALSVNMVFIYEGDQERSEGSSAGLLEVCAANKELFDGGVDALIVSNNYWLDDERPCLTYGMRGNINIEVTVDGPGHDLHSGMDGGVVAEPMVDLMAVLSSLVDTRGMVLAPGFYENVRDVSPAELELYEDIVFDLDAYRAHLEIEEFSVNESNTPTGILMARWRHPALSITGVRTSSGDHVFTNIAKRAVGQFSVRFVPDQTSTELVQVLTQHMSHEFRKRRSPNRLKFNVLHAADWWLGDPFNAIYKSAEKAIETVWKTKPFYVREGGTMSVTAVLEKYLNAPALHLPLGQSSDGAHLPNERISVNNVEKGRDVIKCFLSELGTSLNRS